MATARNTRKDVKDLVSGHDLTIIYPHPFCRPVGKINRHCLVHVRWVYEIVLLQWLSFRQFFARDLIRGSGHNGFSQQARAG
jgi:hypothetical protein